MLFKNNFAHENVPQRKNSSGRKNAKTMSRPIPVFAELPSVMLPMCAMKIRYLTFEEKKSIIEGRTNQSNTAALGRLGWHG